MLEEVIEDEKNKINKHDFYFETSLYDEIKISDLEDNFFEWDVDWYSSVNHIDTTYSIELWWDLYIRSNKIYSKYYQQYTQVKWYKNISLTCKRKNNDEIQFYVYITDETITKIWQYPSLADINFAELWKKYDKILPKNDLENFKKSIWLNAHWIWAGSFVYLRRIFENLIFKTFEENKPGLQILEDDFRKKHMDEKVEILQDFLPEQLVKMKKIYSILSKWVHELSEEECLKFFPVMKLSIELILDQKIEMNKKKDKDLLAKKAIDSILQELA